MHTIKNIFLTDDDADDCLLFSEIVGEIFAKNQPKLTITHDGVKLMEALDETVPPAPEVIFLDLNMPRKNGFECLAEIRKIPKLQRIPIVIISTSSNRDIIDRTFEHGANYYICKPQSYVLLKKTIQQVLSFGVRLKDQPKRSNFVIRVA